MPDDLIARVRSEAGKISVLQTLYGHIEFDGRLECMNLPLKTTLPADALALADRCEQLEQLVAGRFHFIEVSK